MACYPAYISGSFAIALIIFDLVQKEWMDLPYHAIGGVILTALFWALCLISPTLSLAVLIVPAFAFIIFFTTIFITFKSIKNKGCCMKCNSDSPDPPSSPSCLQAKPVKKCHDPTTLRATPLI